MRLFCVIEAKYTDRDSGTWTGSITPLDYSQAPAQTPAKLSKVSRISPMSGVEEADLKIVFGSVS